MIAFEKILNLRKHKNSQKLLSDIIAFMEFLARLFFSKKKRFFLKKPKKIRCLLQLLPLRQRAGNWFLILSVNRIRKDAAKKGVAKLIMVFLQS